MTTIYARMTIGVHSSCSATLVHTNRTNGTYIPTSKKSWYGIILELATQQAHIKSHFSGYIGRNPTTSTRRKIPSVLSFPPARLSGDKRGNARSSQVHKIYHVGCTVIRNLTQKHCQLRHFDVSTKTLFALHLACHVQFIICRFLCEYGCPCIETANPLPLKLLRTQILEHHI